MVRGWALRVCVAAWILLAAGAASPAPVGTPKRHRPVVVGADPHYPPYEFLDPDGNPAGFNVDLTRAIAEVMGMEVVFRFAPWSEIRAGLMEGSIDVLQGLTWSEPRTEVIDFAPPHSIVQHALFARRGTPPVDWLEGLAGREVIVFRGGIMDETLTADGRAHIIRTDTPADSLRLLASGEGEYVALALLPGIFIIREAKLTNIEVVAKRLASEPYGYAFRKGNQELLSQFREGLAILKRTGRYDEIQARWLGVLDPQGVSWRMLARVGAGVLTPLAAILLATFLWTRSLRRQVAQRTASLAQEVSEKRQALEELKRQRQQLVQADKMAALGLLVSEVAHEVNNPTGLILLNLATLQSAFLDARELLDRRTAAGEAFSLAGLPYARMREELPRLIEETLEGGRRIKRFVQDLKDFARREDAPVLGPVDLNAVARGAVRLVEGSLRHATRRFELGLAPALPFVQGSAQRLEQVVVNLLLNACQALPDVGRGIRLTTEHLAPSREVVLEVVDQGTGIAPEHLEHMFEPFFTTKREAGGTGLGLAVSSRIAREHGGRLELLSDVGVGTTVRLLLPEPESSS